MSMYCSTRLPAATLLLTAVTLAGCASLASRDQRPDTSAAAEPVRADVDGGLIAGPAPAESLAVADPADPDPDFSPGFELDDYQIGPQDLLEVSVFGVEELSGTVRVNARGVVALPLLGPVEAAGLTSEQLAERIETELARDYLQDPHVTVFIKEYSSQRVTIEGAVTRPGIYVLSDRTTLLQAIALAQGLDQLADSSDVKLFRAQAGGEKLALSYNLDQIRAGDVEDPLLRGSDVVVVQKSTGRTFLRDSIFRDAIDFLNPFSRLPGL